MVLLIRVMPSRSPWLFTSNMLRMLCVLLLLVVVVVVVTSLGDCVKLPSKLFAAGARSGISKDVLSSSTHWPDGSVSEEMFFRDARMRSCMLEELHDPGTL